MLKQKSKYVHLFMALMAFTAVLIFAPAGSAAEPPRQAEAEWLIMMYQVADDETLEQAILGDFNEAEFIGSSDDVHVVAQVDRFTGGFDGMGDWTSAKRYYLTPDDDFETINSLEVDDIGEVNMADAETLVDFIVWAAENYPARKHALIMSDHGMGWPGGFADPDPGILGADNIPLAEGFGDSIWLMELDDALERARAQAGIDQFELIGFDVCLMGTIEVFSAMAPHARYSVASEEEEPGVGWAYAAFLNEVNSNPSMAGDDLSKAIVEAYIDQDLVVQAFPEAGEGDITLAAVDLSQMSNLHMALDDFTADLAGLDQTSVAEARAYAQAYNSPIVGAVDENLPSSYIDLGHFAQLIEESNPETAASVSALQDAIQSAVIAEKHGPTRPGSTGMTIEFPVAGQYGVLDNLGYTLVAQRFTDATQWDEFLALHHANDRRENFSRPDAQPQPTAEEELVEIPGITSEDDLEILIEDIQFLLDEGYPADEALEIMEFDYGWPPETVAFLSEQGVFEANSGRSSRSQNKGGVAKPIQVAPLTLSAEVATPDEPMLIQTDISGDRLGYVYSFIGRFLPREDILIIEDMDYIFADDSQEIGGVTRPVWPQEGFGLDYDWSPTIFAISDGQTSVRALFEPESYGESPTYQVKGIYTFGDSGATRPARMSFRDGEMTQIFAFSGQGGVGAPRQVTPKAGDTFTVLERGIDFNQDTEEENYAKESGTLTFGDEPFFIEETPAPSGNYVVGIIAEDLDGQRTEQYEGLFVVSEDESAVDGFVPYINEELAFALLYPETWAVEEDAAEGTVSFIDDNSGTVAIINRQSFPEAKTNEEANTLAVQAFIAEVEQDGELENLEFITEAPEDFVLGAFDGKIFEFAFELEGIPFVASVVAASPTPDVTYGVLILAPDETFEATVDDVDSMLVSFDVLLSGISKEQIGAPPPDVDEVIFFDDFSDAASGLIEDETEQEWGRGYYTPTGQYTFELKPDPGAIYDFYLDEILPDTFLLEAVTSYNGADDNAYGLIFQVLPAESESDADRFYTFRITGDGFYTVEKAGDALQPLIDWTYTNAINQGAQTENILTVEGLGDGSYNLYINGRQVNTFTDADPSAYSGGTFGLIVDNFDSEQPATFIFDDLGVGLPAQ